MNYRLSILESTRADKGLSGYTAIRNSTDVALAADECGYHRLWVTEHHGQPEIASSAPPVLVAHLAARTSRVRVGSGGVMLVNHSPLVVAEQFATLEALYPGRIDLGVGGALGSPRAEIYGQALQRPAVADADYARRIDDLVGFVSGRFPEDHPYRGVQVSPRVGATPIFLLGGSERGAKLAAARGLPFAFAHHLGGAPLSKVLECYRSAFQPSSALTRPYSIVTVGVSCTGMATEPFDPARSNMLIDSPPTVARQLDELIARAGADEAMVVPLDADGASRVRVVRSLAEQVLAGAHGVRESA